MGEADEEVQRSDGGEVCLFCGFVRACLSIYLRPSRLFKYRELYYAVVLAETFSVPNTHCLPTNSSPCSLSISGNISESSN